ncbi:MAG: flavodoxin-dependent (E)-4-hydroxy-3-methylbut-2-enyl-diphosphate synthase [Candidatus Margulisiibacteriota bacterium]|jgi:(E)-4-hydroxy-3-methylbut-2-enyl-diphosphate synthase
MLIRKRPTPIVYVGNVVLGGNSPIVIQAMTNTPTANIEATVEQIKELATAGAELVRVTINHEPAMQAIPRIIELLHDQGINIPIIGDFHYNGHILLKQFPNSANALAKYRINPGNVGQDKSNFEFIINVAKYLGKAVRIGVNGGSINLVIYNKLLARNAALKKPQPLKNVYFKALVNSAVKSANHALKLGLCKNKLVLSIKVSEVPDVIKVNQELASKIPLAIHLGLTEAGSGIKGITASSVALGVLLNAGIGDTIRVSLTPEPNKPRSQEVEVAKEILQSLGLRFFKPQVTSCPGCGRTNSAYYIDLAQEIKDFIEQNYHAWLKINPEIAKVKIAIMGCVVNGPGESKNADIGISLPGDNEDPKAPVYIAGEKVATLEGNITEQFKNILEKYFSEK